MGYTIKNRKWGGCFRPHGSKVILFAAAVGSCPQTNPKTNPIKPIQSPFLQRLRGLEYFLNA